MSGSRLSLLICVLLPIAVSAWYLWTRAADQYASTVGFTVRREESSSAIGLLGGLSSLVGMSTSSSSDTDILYEYIQSQELVSKIDKQLDLRRIWSRPVKTDPVFAYHPPGTDRGSDEGMAADGADRL